jgi:hypothetical protein
LQQPPVAGSFLWRTPGRQHSFSMGNDQSEDASPAPTAVGDRGKELQCLVPRLGESFCPCPCTFCVVAGNFFSNLLSWSPILLLRLLTAVDALLSSLPYPASSWGSWLRQLKQAISMAAGEFLKLLPTQHSFTSCLLSGNHPGMHSDSQAQLPWHQLVHTRY